MFSKSLIVVLLGCTLVSANPIQGIQGNTKLIPQPKSISDTLDVMLQGVHKEIKNTFTQTVRSFADTYNSLVEASKNIQKFSIEKIEQLRSKFFQIIDDGREALSDIEAVILSKKIQHLQKLVEYLTTLNSNIINGQGNQGIDQYLRPEQQVPNKGNQILQELLNNQKGNLNTLQNAWLSGTNKVEEFIKNNQNGIPTNANGNFNNFIGNIQEPFKQFTPDGLKTITDRFGNVLPTQGFDMADGLMGQFGNQMQKTVQTRKYPFNHLQNLPSPIDGLKDGITEATGNSINNSEQTFNTMLQQFTEAVTPVMNAINQALQQWKNEVDAFLTTGKTNVEQSPQSGGPNNILGNGGQGLTGMLPNISIPKLPGMDEAINNIQGIVNQGTNMMEGMKPPGIPGGSVIPKLPGLDEGMFSKLGQKVGGHIGGGVDKFTNAVGGIWQNAANMFGK